MNKKVSPMIFNGDMVRALLAGNKTQTRWPINEYKYGIDFLGGQGCSRNDPKNWGAEDGGRGGICYLELTDGAARFNDYQLKRPFGGKGDLIYVREAFTIVPRTAYRCSEGVDQLDKPGCDHDAAIFRAGWDRSPPGKWKPSTNMPRWASRLTLRITDVRVERVQDIGGSDALAEGIERSDWKCACDPYRNYGHPRMSPGKNYSSPAASYASLWDSLYNNWDDNPWVWVYTFKVIRQNVDALITQEDS